MDDFETHSVVGEGEFGRVVLVSNRFDPTEPLLAMKVVRKRDLLL